MKLGIKVGTNLTQSLMDLDATNPAMCEVWFNIGKSDDYVELFRHLKGKKIDVGLHFWGALPDGTAANLSYPDAKIIKETLALMHKTIEIAAQNNFQYVNIHPGFAVKIGIDFEAEQTWRILSTPIDLNLSESLFLENAKQLSDFANRLGIIFTVETVPARAPINMNISNRQDIINPHELPAQTIIKAAKLGIFVANDFSHTAGNLITSDRNAIWQFLYNTTKSLIDQTKLIHLGFLQPPFNGTDNHDMLDNPLLETDQAVPNKNQMIELLKLFKNRADVWILTEPKEDHIKNYFLAQKILKQAENSA